ncbi:acid protease [Flagelloscypha sp. PMI_526]|nr:acid protease [Flagelloscypha sp. PMI_526]
MMLGFISFLLLAPVAIALHLPVQITKVPRSSVARGSSALENTNDQLYWTNITLGGTKFAALIDTGSSDSWVATSTPLSNSSDTGKSLTLQYVHSSVTGSIKTNQLKDFLGFTVEEQAYIEVKPDEFTLDGTGLIGFGPRFSSKIYTALDGSAASVPVLDSIFLQNTSTPNFVTFLLGRKKDPTDSFDGNITVSTILPGYEKIVDQPKVPAVTTVNQSGFKHWALLVDAIKGPKGNNIRLKSSLKSDVTDQFTVKPNGKLVAVTDNGFSFSQVPTYITEEIYKDVEGSKKIEMDGNYYWVFPCTAELNVTITLGGVDYLVHSLDASYPITDTFELQEDKDAIRDEVRKKVDFDGDICQATFEEIPSKLNTQPYDLILGMNFLRNVYQLINHGDFIAGNNSARGDPYFHFLSTTNDSSLTHQEFIKVRGEGGATFKAKGPGLGAGRVVAIVASVLFILLGFVSCFCWKKRKSDRSIFSDFPAKFPFIKGSRGRYAQLHKEDNEQHPLRAQSHRVTHGPGE